MKSNTKSSITLPAGERKVVEELKVRLQLASNVDVIRAGLRLLKESTDREALRAAYQEASKATRAGLEAEIGELDHLAGEGMGPP